MTTYYVNTSTGDDSNDGSEGAPWATLTKASSTIAADDTVMVAPGTYTEASLTWPSRCTILGVDAAGVSSDDPFTETELDRTTLPIVTAASGSMVMNLSSAGPYYVRGLRFNVASLALGVNATSSSSAILEIKDCEFWGATFRQLAIRNASTVERCVFRDGTAYGVYVAGGNDQVVRACEFRDLANAAIYHITNGNQQVENCTFLRTCSAQTFWNYTITSTGVMTIKNCLSVDNHSKYGGANAWQYSNAWTSDGATYHTSGNWNGGAGTGSQSADPLFEDEPADDLRLGTGSPSLEAGTTATATHLADGQAMPVSPPQGAYIGVGVPPLSQKSKTVGTHQVQIDLTNGYFDGDNADPDTWTITGVTTAPLVATVTLSQSSVQGSDTVYSVATLHTDRPLLEHVTYTITTATAIYNDLTISDVVIPGIRSSYLVGPGAPPGAPLRDFSAPLVRADGAPGGFYDHGDDGDYELTGGVATILKAVWAVLLTGRGELSWSPEFGSAARLKRLAPADKALEAKRLRAQVLAIPYVTDATVTLEIKTNAAWISVSVRTDFGDATQTREVPL